MRPAGRGLDKDHPDNRRRFEEALADLRRIDRELARREEEAERKLALAAEVDDGLDRYEPCDDAYARMEQERKNGHPNEWVR